MKLGALTFDKKALLKAPADEVQLFLALAHATNEINALLRLVLWTADYSSPTEAFVHGQVTLSYIVRRLLAGKLNEAYGVLRSGYFGSELARSYDAHLTPEAKEALTTLNRYFGKTNLIHEIRNRFSFHYDIPELGRALPEVHEELVAYLQEGGSANNLYYLAEVIATTAAVTATSTTDVAQALRSFTNDLLVITKAFTAAGDALIGEFIRRYPSIAQGGLVEVVLPELEPMLQVKLPWFTDPSDLDGSAA